MVTELIDSCDVLDDLLSKTRQGVAFYEQLEGNMRRVQERCRAVCGAQAEEREQIKARLKPKGQSVYVRPVFKLKLLSDAVDSCDIHSMCRYTKYVARLLSML